MSAYTRNHYVPKWYQYRFIPPEKEEKTLYYLDLKPPVINSNGHKYKKDLRCWGPKFCFYEDDLYTTQFDEWKSTEIEEKFFGKIDGLAGESLDHFAGFEHTKADKKLHYNLLVNMSVQKLRTPKGLGYLSKLTNIKDKNMVLIQLQQLQAIYCAIWTESQWSIADASCSNTKFIISDNPVTTYNQACFPLSKYCRDFNDPDIRYVATHTLFPLNLNKILILTNKSWFYNPYSNPLKLRPNPDFFRDTFFNFLDIQVGRMLTEDEVNQINYIIKSRAYKYIASANKEWLYPENKIIKQRWDSYGRNYLLMPDPRSSHISSGPLIGYENGSVDAFDIHGRKPWQDGYEDQNQLKKQNETFHAFKGEYARKFGPLRRGLTGEFSSQQSKVDSQEYHAYHCKIPKYKKNN